MSHDPPSSLASLHHGQGGFWLIDDTGTNFVHYTDGTWTTEPAPSDPGDTTDIGGVALIPGTQSVWADAELYDSNGIPQSVVVLQHGS